jgi:hypothetical protein
LWKIFISLRIVASIYRDARIIYFKRISFNGLIRCALRVRWSVMPARPFLQFAYLRSVPGIFSRQERNLKISDWYLRHVWTDQLTHHGYLIYIFKIRCIEINDHMSYRKSWFSNASIRWSYKLYAPRSVLHWSAWVGHRILNSGTCMNILASYPSISCKWCGS